MPPSNEETPMELNDELLSAYLDDALDAEVRARVESAMDADPGARLRLENMRQADQSLRNALPPRGGDHFEALLVERVAGRSAAPATRRGLVPWAVAASLAGLIAGYLLPRMDTGNGPQVLDRALVRALDTQRSGAPVVAGSQVLLTFQAADGRYCRLFRAGAADAMGEGLACRDEAGWQLTAWDASAPESVDGFRTAGASALVDGAMVALGGKPAMSAAEEMTAIKGGWPQP
jgi:hypothetical protein